MLTCVKRILHDKQGNFGILTAILIVPLLGAAGIALDFSRALELKTFLDGAADAAALGAISQTSKAVAKAQTMIGDGTIVLPDEEAVELFNANLASRWGEDSSAADAAIRVEVALVRENGNLSSKVTYSATMPTVLMQVLGKDTMNISGQATASYKLPAFLDFYMVLDNTPSMGVGATASDIEKLQAATAGAAKDANCAFACHIVSSDGVEDTNDYYHLAKSIGATIRIDVVTEAVNKLMSTAQKAQTVASQFRMSAYSFGKSATDTGLYAVANPTIDLAAFGKAAAMIELMTLPSRSYAEGQTDYNAVLKAINNKIINVGKGTSSSDRQPIVFMVADGVSDALRSDCQKALSTSKGNRCMEPINVKYCEDMKSRGIQIAVLYTTYLPLPENSFYRSWIAPFNNEIPSNMKACATDGYYFEVGPAQGISEAMNALFLKIVSKLRLTS